MRRGGKPVAGMGRLQVEPMSTLQNILFPVDFSASCVAMAPYAKRAAAILEAKVTLLHVFDLYRHDAVNSTYGRSPRLPKSCRALPETN